MSALLSDMVCGMGNECDKPDSKSRLKDTRLDAGRRPMESLLDYWVRLGLMKATSNGIVVDLGRTAVKPKPK